jgi:uncharacterized protein YdhG (YjbR/CyaY superfamily)
VSELNAGDPMPREKFQSVEQYVEEMDPEIQPRINELRDLIKATAPGVEERISYNIPGYRLNGHYLIYLSAARAHIGLYPATETMKTHFGARLEPYLSGKATIKLKNSDPLPIDFIREIVEFKMSEIAKLKPRK